VSTYLERDVRALSNIGNLSTFRQFLQLCAGRSGCLLNYSSLAADCGISQPTAKQWISLLEASCILFCITSFRGNSRKRVTKMPKLYFFDTGLMCWLLGIRKPDQIRSHPLRGQIFETWVSSEVLKSRCNAGLRGGIHFYRDHNAVEVDLVIPEADQVQLVEAKSTSTAAVSMLRRIRSVRKHLRHLSLPVEAAVAYGGDEFQRFSDGMFIPWRKLNFLSQPERRISDDNRFELVIVSAESQPLSGSEVMALFPNGTYVAALTDEYGIARLTLYRTDQPMKVYVASTGFAAHVETDWVPQMRRLQVDLYPLVKGGSVIFPNATGEVPGLAGSLNPIADEQDRMYLDADNSAINHGERQPVSFELGEELHLMDALGVERNIQVIDMTGRSVLLEYESAS